MESPHFIIMKRNMSISFNEEIWEKLRDMRNSSDFVNALVTDALSDGEHESEDCELCDSKEKPLVWVMPMEKLVCPSCEKRLLFKSQHGGHISTGF